MVNIGGEHGDDAQRESAEAEVHSVYITLQQSDVQTRNKSLINSSFLCPSSSSLIPVPPVSQWHDHASVVSISTPASSLPDSYFDGFLEVLPVS